MELSGKRIAVVGLGKSGLAAAKLCQARGANVFGVDAEDNAALRANVSAAGFTAHLGSAEAREVLEADLVVVSPGVPQLPVFAECERAGLPVIGELELGARFLSAPILAVGGTNGKSTTTKLAAEMLQAAGLRVFVGGNYGVPVCEAVDLALDVAVLEVSSFQLERAPSFRPKVSILLNITDDHLDRYPNFDAYAAAKGNAFVNQTADDVAVIPAADPGVEAQAQRGQGRRVYFGAGAEADYGIVISSAARSYTLVERASGNALDLAATTLHGRHNWLNLAAAVAAVRALGVAWPAVEQTARTFQPLLHRMAHVAEHRGVAYYDDSKGTNVGAAVTALLGLMEERVVLIAGGRDKQGSYAPLVAALAERGRGLVVLGEAAGKIAEAAEGVLPVVRVLTMDQAVVAASKLAQPGDAVLLSPACSSFDQYSSYAERGDDFARRVRDLVALNPEAAP